MPLKPESSQSPIPKKIGVWIGTQRGGFKWIKFVLIWVRQKLQFLRRSLVAVPSFRFRAGLSFILGFMVGMIMPLVIFLTGFDIQDLKVPHFVGRSIEQSQQTIAQGMQWLSPTPATAMPQAITGLAEPKLWGHAIRLAAYLGHFPYPKVAPEQLTRFSSFSSNVSSPGELLHPDASKALATMIQDAQAQGVWIVLVSGFRDLVTQNTLFQARAEAYGSEAEAAKVVAPPGYSEHHTGYAIDVTDGSGQIFYDFAETRAYQWMQVHAHEYGFELSFPQDNPQGVDFEPWHWRFIGSPEAQHLFAPARS
ncbi:MAG: hypothetical protein Kow00121_61670 [Elainellaceae cyanobacterium]